MTTRRRMRADDGTALVEFTWLAIILMIPLVYVVLSALSVQRAAFATTAAAREAARAYATAGSDAEGERRAEQAVELVMHDQGVAWTPVGRVVQCGSCDYAAGSPFVVELRTKVSLPLVPRWMCSSRCLAGVTVSGRHGERIDCFAGNGVPTPGSPC
jgi:hypothetical protein